MRQRKLLLQFSIAVIFTFLEQFGKLYFIFFKRQFSPKIWKFSSKIFQILHQLAFIFHILQIIANIKKYSLKGCAILSCRGTVPYDFRHILSQNLQTFLISG